MNQPPGWELVALDCLVDHSRGITYGIIKTGDPVVGGVPTVRGGDIKRFHIEASALKRVDPSIAHQFLRTELRGHELVISIRGSVGSVAVVSPDLAGCNVSREVAVIPALPHLIEPEFAKFFLASPSAQSAMAGKVKGVAQQGINLEDLRALDTPLPPLNEQRRIVARIEELTSRSKSAKEALQAIPPLLEKFRQSVLAAAFRGDLTAEWRRQNPDVESAEVLLERIRVERRKRSEESGARGKYVEPEPVDASGLPELPMGWCWARLDCVTYNHDGRRIPLEAKERSKRPGPYPYYGASGVIDSLDAFLFDGDYLLVAEDGANLLSRKTPIAFLAIGQFWVNNHAHVLVTAGGMPLSYVEHFLNGLDLSFVVTGSAQPKLTQKALNNILVPLAPLEEQRALTETLGTHFQMSRAVREEIREGFERSFLIDQSILSKAFRGELVPQDPADEPASTLLDRIRAERTQHTPARQKRK